jgi:hypothetical protein
MVLRASDTWKLWSLLLAIFLGASSVAVYYSLTTGEPPQGTSNIGEQKSNFIQDQLEKDDGPGIRGDIPPVISPVGREYNEFRNNFKNLRDEQDVTE